MSQCGFCEREAAEGVACAVCHQPLCQEEGKVQHADFEYLIRDLASPNRADEVRYLCTACSRGRRDFSRLITAVMLLLGRIPTHATFSPHIGPARPRSSEGES